MTRALQDWLATYLDYTDNTEPPKHVRFWAGVSAIAGALRRKVWIDQEVFQWYPNFYILLVAPPAVISKTTTASISLRLLRKLPGIRFGPDVVTWPKLVEKFAGAMETFEWPPGCHNPMCALTLESGEIGNLINPQDREMIDLYVTLWDGKQGSFQKETKTQGNDEIVNPWINMIGCTTPDWIAGSCPDYMINGGFFSRCIMVYADEKAQEIAYPRRKRRQNRDELEKLLVHDLAEIASIRGEYQLTEEAYQWGEAWYSRLQVELRSESDQRIRNYLARKQVHIHKLAMVIAAAQSNRLWIEPAHLALALTMVEDLEPDMHKVFSKVGRSDNSLHAERLLHFIRAHKEVPWEVAYRYMHKEFPGLREYNNIIDGLTRSGLVQLAQDAYGKFTLVSGSVH